MPSSRRSSDWRAADARPAWQASIALPVGHVATGTVPGDRFGSTSRADNRPLVAVWLLDGGQEIRLARRLAVLQVEMVGAGQRVLRGDGLAKRNLEEVRPTPRAMADAHRAREVLFAVGLVVLGYVV